MLRPISRGARHDRPWSIEARIRTAANCSIFTLRVLYIAYRANGKNWHTNTFTEPYFRVVTRTDVDWIVVYDFVFDRLRAVRQDIAIQRIQASSSIKIYEPIIRFLVYSSQRLCDRKLSEFDPKINNQHLAECIKHVLVLYDEIERDKANGKLDIEKSLENLMLKDNRPEMEALYILLYMGNVEALERALKLPKTLRQTAVVRIATKISLAWYLRNYVSVFHLIQRLPPILVCAALTNLQTLRRTALKVMCSGYNSKVLTFPGAKLQEILLYKGIDKAQTDCEHLGLKLTDQNILFQKASFNDTVKMESCERYYSQEALQSLLPDILLGSI